MTHNKSADGHLTLSPKMSFVLGLTGGIMLLCTIGFFILLGMVMKKGSLNSVAPSGAVPSADQVAPAPSPSAPPAEAVGEVTPLTDEDNVWGPDNAQVTLIEYSDIECPYCQRFQSTISQIKDAYKGKVKIAFRHFPLSFHPNSKSAAVAAECAGEQGNFWDYLDELYANQSNLGDSTYKSVAKKFGLNSSKFASCLTSGKYDDKIAADQASGAKAGVTGTPGTIILGADGSTQLIPGALPFEQVKPMIDAAF